MYMMEQCNMQDGSAEVCCEHVQYFDLAHEWDPEEEWDPTWEDDAEWEDAQEDCEWGHVWTDESGYDRSEAMGAMTMNSTEDGYAIGILDSGATRTSGSWTHTESTHMALGGSRRSIAAPTNYSFAGGEAGQQAVAFDYPCEALAGSPVRVGTILNDVTPVLIGTDVLRQYGMVLDFSCDRVWSKTLDREIPVVVFPNGHLGMSLKPPDHLIVK